VNDGWGDLFPDEVCQLINAGVTPDEALKRIREIETYNRRFPALPLYYRDKPPWWKVAARHRWNQEYKWARV